MRPKSLRGTLFAAGLLGAGLLAACAGGPHAAPVPAGLTYECEPGGLATITFNGGGYLPDSSVWGTNEKGERAQVPRSAAQLTYDGHKYDMVAEVVAAGLRYRSAAKHDGEHYLVWTTRRADEHGSSEDASLTLRSDPRTDGPVEREIARCTRSGRAHEREAADHESGGDHGKDDPHAP